MGFEQLEYTLVEGELTAVCVTFDKNLEKKISLEYLLQNSTGKCMHSVNNLIMRPHPFIVNIYGNNLVTLGFDSLRLLVCYIGHFSV